MGILTTLFLLAALAGPDPAYQAEIEKWRQSAERSLRSENGWLTVSGLFWLKPGENRLGSGEDNAIALPAGVAPARAGVIVLQTGRVRFQLAPGSNALHNGRPATEGELRSDRSGMPDTLVFAQVSLTVIERGDRIGIRMRDSDSTFRKQFTGRKWYPVNEDYRIRARFEPYQPARKISVPNVLGQASPMECPGRVVFSRDGRQVSLEAIATGPNLWFIFKDETSGKTTYPAGRFLDAPGPKDGVVILDFNKATSPPCAFTPYATCPLPPKGNSLPIRIEAGEMKHH